MCRLSSHKFSKPQHTQKENQEHVNRKIKNKKRNRLNRAKSGGGKKNLLHPTKTTNYKLHRNQALTFNITDTCLKKTLLSSPLSLSLVTEMRHENHENREHCFTRWRAILFNLTDFFNTCSTNKIALHYIFRGYSKE